MSTTLSSHSLSGFRPASDERQRDVLQRGQRRHQVVRLEDEADLVATQLRECLVVQAATRSVVADEHLPVGERVEAGDAVHERRLARARRAHDGAEATGLELHRDPVERAHFVVALAVDLHCVDRTGGSRGDRCRGVGRCGHGADLSFEFVPPLGRVQRLGTPRRRIHAADRRVRPGVSPTWRQVSERWRGVLPLS